MKQQNEITGKGIEVGPLVKNMITGAVIALIVISAFLISAGEANPAWGKSWRVRPLLIVPFAGAMGGAFFYFMEYLARKGGWSRVLAIVTGLIGYVVALWLGSVLGLDGTYWN